MTDTQKPGEGFSGFASLCLGQFLAQQTALTFSALIPIVSGEWRLSAIQAGLILGAFQLGSLIAYVVVGILLDRMASKPIMVWAVVVGLGDLLFALVAHDFWSGLGLRLLVGASLGGLYLPALKHITETIPKEVAPRPRPPSPVWSLETLCARVCAHAGIAYLWVKRLGQPGAPRPRAGLPPGRLLPGSSAGGGTGAGVGEASDGDTQDDVNWNVPYFRMAQRYAHPGAADARRAVQALDARARDGHQADTKSKKGLRLPTVTP